MYFNDDIKDLAIKENELISSAVCSYLCVNDTYSLHIVLKLKNCTISNTSNMHITGLPVKPAENIITLGVASDGNVFKGVIDSSGGLTVTCLLAQTSYNDSDSIHFDVLVRNK